MSPLNDTLYREELLLPLICHWLAAASIFYCYWSYGLRVGILGVLCASRPSILYSFNAAKVGEEVLVEQSYL